MAIIIGDIHGNVEKVRAFLAYKPEAEHVALGDYLDSFHEPVERQLEALRLLMESSAVLLWGNHDLHYLDNPLFEFPGYSDENAKAFRPILEGDLGRFKAAYVADGWLCTHAGVHAGIAKGFSVSELERQFADEWKAYLDNRSAGYRFQSIFRFDFMAEGTLAPYGIKQVFGHDHHRNPGCVHQNCIAVGCSDRGSCWVFDTENKQVLDLLTPFRELSEKMITDKCSLCGGDLGGNYSPWSIGYDPLWYKNVWGGDTHVSKALLCQKCAEKLFEDIPDGNHRR